jgi:ribosomal protein L37AE/L43A
LEHAEARTTYASEQPCTSRQVPSHHFDPAAGRKRIEPHGPDWRRACADLGIPDETARHRLPLPRSEVRRNYTYACPHCGFTAQRVRKFRRFTACRECCAKHNGGLYDGRFRFVLVEDKRATAKKAKP